MPRKGIIAFDLDGTLAHHEPGPYHPLEIGPPVPKMVARLKRYLAEGYQCVIFTARAADNSPHVEQAIQEWSRQNLGVVLPVTATKWPQIVRFYDDRAVQVLRNTGEIVE